MRIRSLASLFCLVVAALAIAPRDAMAAPPLHPSVAAPDSIAVDSIAAPLARAVIQAADTHHAPAPRSPAPLSMFSMLGFAVGATAKAKRPTRRARKDVKVPDVPLFLDSDVHVMRDGELTLIKGGVLVDDTELEDDEIEDLIKHHVVRPAKHEELQAIEATGSMTAIEDLKREQDQEIQALQSAHASALAEADASGNITPAKREKLVTKQAEELAALQSQHAAALNKLSA